MNRRDVQDSSRGGQPTVVATNIFALLDTKKKKSSSTTSSSSGKKPSKARRLTH